LNQRVDNEKVTGYLWREPFRSLVTFIENSDGADERTGAFRIAMQSVAFPLHRAPNKFVCSGSLHEPPPLRGTEVPAPLIPK
jgi:hypothetical protein